MNLIQRLRDWFKQGKSPLFRGVLIGVIGTLVVIGIFQAGMVVGFHKALFMTHMQNRGLGFERGSNGMHMMRLALPGGGPEMHGALGTIKRISLPAFTLTERGASDREVLIGTTTKIRRGHDEINPQDLRVQDHVIIFGEPDVEARIQARLIRVMDQDSGKGMQGR